MATVRRLYFYLVAFISLMMLMVGLMLLAQLMLAGQFDRREEISLYSALVLVGLPIFLGHWLFMQRAVSRGDEERGAALRKLYFYAILGVTALVAMTHAEDLLRAGLKGLLGGGPVGDWDEVSGWITGLVVPAVLWVYQWRLARRDAAVEPEVGRQAMLRRLYFYAIGGVGLFFLFLGLERSLTGLARLLIEGVALGSDFWQARLSTDVARIVVGGAIWLFHWMWIQRVAAVDEEEQCSALRKFYLYLVIFATAATTLFNVTWLLNQVLQIALGEPVASGRGLLGEAAGPLALILTGAAFWFYHWRVLQWDAGLAREAPRQASIRRLYYYLVAAIGVALVGVGVSQLLGTLLRLWLGWSPPFTTEVAWWRDQVSLYAAMILVGGPVWLTHWRPMQGRALALDQDGAEERASTLRKVYLYLVIFASVVTVLFTVAWFLFRVINLLLGGPTDGTFAADLSSIVADALVAVLAWVYHWRAVQRDAALAGQVPAAPFVSITVTVIDGGDGTIGRAIVRHVRQKVSAAEIVPFALTAQAATALALELGSAVEVAQGTAAFPQADALVGSVEVMIPGGMGGAVSAELAEAVRQSAGTKVLLPVSVSDWDIVGQAGRSVDALAREAAQRIRRLVAERETELRRLGDVERTTDGGD